MTKLSQTSLLALAMGMTAVMLTGCGKRAKPIEAPPPTAVEVVSVVRQDISDFIEVTGSVKALEDVVLSAKMGGKVVSVPFREGARVFRGATVVQQETVDLQNQVRAAQAGLASAQARLSQARTSADLTKVQTDASIKQAEKALQIAQDQYRIAQQGLRPQEKRQVEQQVSAALSVYNTAEANLNRVKKLHQEGAVSKASLDVAQQQFDQAKSGLESAREALSMAREGSRPEELSIARNQVVAAEERLRQARAELQSVKMRKDDVQAAEAAVKQAASSLAMAKQALADSSIRTPIAGLVAERSVEPGEMIGAGTPVMRVYNPSTVYYEALVSEVDVDRVRTGQSVTIVTEALPGRVFSGSVQKVFPAAVSQNRSFMVRISLSATESGLKPGMFAKGRIIVDNRVNQLVLPVDAVMRADGRTYVFVVEKGIVKKPAAVPEGKKPPKNPEMIEVESSIAKRREISAGLQSDGMVQILSGLKDNDTVVRTGQTYLKEGQEVAILEKGTDTP